jgi:ABC-type multidrug transport system ATPase subunit
LSAVPPILIKRLRKEYRSRRGVTIAVDGLDLEVESGGVFGFLGPNGAGKTTTMRCLLGLARPTSGRLELFGADVGTDLPKVIHRVGAVVESPKFFPSMSGRLNLELLGGATGTSASDVDRVLEAVELADRADDSFKAYSLGMKQRLAVAATLLKDPELLILDEPANGLDPAGIRSMRSLIRDLGDAGKTVFVSSHILAEIQLMCDSVAIIDDGRLVASGSVADLIEGASKTLAISVGDAEGATQVLTQAGFSVTEGDRAGSLTVVGEGVDPAALNELLANAGHYVSELRSNDLSLEDRFLELTEDGS